MPKHISEYLRPIMEASVATARAEQGTVAEAFAAHDLLKMAVQWHMKHEEAMIPTELLAILYAARRVC